MHLVHDCMFLWDFTHHIHVCLCMFCDAFVLCSCALLCGICAWMHVHLCIPLCVRVCGCVRVCVCIYKGEVRGRRGDDMHVSGLLTSLTTRTLTDCPPSRHDGCTGKPTAPLPLSVSQIPFLVFPLCVHLLISHWMFFVSHSGNVSVIETPVCSQRSRQMEIIEIMGHLQ